MPLLTIADLEQSQAERVPYIKMAQQLKTIFLDHVASSQDDDVRYEVSIRGSKTRSNGIHASEASGCMRPAVYSLMGTERKPVVKTDTNMLMRFGIGHAVHAMIQDTWHRIAAKSNGRILFQDEVKMSPHQQDLAAQWEINSSCDGEIILCDETGEPQVRIILEIKTESDGQYEKLRQPRDKHKEQTNLYMAVLDAPLTWLLYYNKSNSSITDSTPPWLFQFDKKMWEDNQEMRFAKMHHLAETATLPERDEGFECSWCAFAWTCQPKTQAHNSRATTLTVINPAMRVKR